MKACIVVPTNREKNAREFLEAWEKEFTFNERVLNETPTSKTTAADLRRVIVVEDNPERTFALPDWVTHVSWKEIDADLKDDAWIIPRRTGAIRNYGNLLASRIPGLDMIVNLDDDCMPDAPRFLDTHWLALDTPGDLLPMFDTVEALSVRDRTDQRSRHPGMESRIMIEPITVVTATVNRSSLPRAVESVQRQTLRPVRHCLLFQQLMRSPVIDLPRPSDVPLRIDWLTPPQPNIVEAYNRVEAMADTPWVAMLDDDCWWEPDHLLTLARLAEETNADFVWGSSICTDLVSGREVFRRNSDRPDFGYIDTNEILFRKTCIERWGGFRVEDCDQREFPKLRGIDGRRIERWVKGGATYAHSEAYTVHYGWRERPEF